MDSAVVLEGRPEALSKISQRFHEKTAQVGVIGLGYVGLPLALLVSRRGLASMGYDIDLGKIEKLQRGESYINHVPESLIAGQIRGGNFGVASNFESLENMDAVIICVPTPLDEHREPDLSYVRHTAETVAGHLRRGQLIVLESTTYPGTTEEVVLPILRQSGLRCPTLPYNSSVDLSCQADWDGSDFLLTFSPEREDPGNQWSSTATIPKVLGGVNAASALAAHALYSQAFDRTVLVSSVRVAEMTKLLENVYRCVNIALVNELKLLSLRMGIDIWEVIDAAATKPFGFSPFYPGPGLGGHCIPIDPFYLTWKAREYEFSTRFIELAGEINAAMPFHVVNALAEAMNQRGQCVYGTRILVLGVAYRKDVDDLRESPSLRIMDLLQRRGARVEYNDPFIPRLSKTREHEFALSSVEITPDVLRGSAAVVIATDHSRYDYDFIVRHARLVLDTRNATRNVREEREKIVRC
jgi:UDP-N-acetyl-D-glucosamine dehydrogenase